MTLATSAARGAAATYGAQAVKVLTQVASIVVLARLLTPNQYGVVTMVLAIAGVALVFGDLGLSMAAMQSQTLTQQQRSNLLWINAGLGCVLGACIVLAAPLIAGFYGKDELRGVAESLSVVFVIYALIPQFRAELASRFAFRWLAISDATAQAVGFAAALCLALAGFGYWALVWNQLVAASVTLLLIAIGARWKPNLPRKTAGMRPLLRYGLDTLGVQLLTYVSTNLDSILIGGPLGATFSDCIPAPVSSSGSPSSRSRHLLRQLPSQCSLVCKGNLSASKNMHAELSSSFRMVSGSYCLF